MDHALLLCSLLLGFSLDAYVCLGSSADGAHAWVLTRESKKVNGRVIVEEKYWESLTGKIYKRNDERVNYLYRRIGCIFNDRSFFGNVQKDDTAIRTRLNLEDETCWKTMGDISLFLPPKPKHALKLIPPSNDCVFLLVS